jgi:hypothetical protein
MKKKKDISAAAAMLGRLGGARNTPKQQKAARINGRKGGRPRIERKEQK